MGSLDPEGPIDPDHPDADFDQDSGLLERNRAKRRLSDKGKGEHDYKVIGKTYQFRRFVTSPWGSSISLSIVFLTIVATIYGVKWWVDYEDELAKRAAYQREGISEEKAAPLSVSTKEVESITPDKSPETAELLILSGQYEKALAELNNLDPSLQTSDKKLMEAFAYAKLNQQEQALEAFHASITKDESNANAYFHWGQYLRFIGAYEEAIPKLKRASDLEPQNQLYRTFWGVARVQNGTYFSLLWEAEKAIFIDPAPGDWLMITAAICLEVGDTDQALRMIKYAEVRMNSNEFRQSLADPYFQRSTYDPNIAQYYMGLFL